LSRRGPDEQSDPTDRSRRCALRCANGTGYRPVSFLGGAAIDLPRLCRGGTSPQPDNRACCPWSRTTGGQNNHGGQSNAQQNEATSFSLEKANRGRAACETAGRGAGTAQAGSESRSCSAQLIAYAARLIRKSSIRLPDFNCAVSQRGVLPRPAQVSDGWSGFRYFGTTAG
jgi:hypothetical protein